MQACNAFCPDIIGHPWKGKDLNASTIRDLVSFSRSFDVVLVGNGIEKNQTRYLRPLIEKLLALHPCVVLDATAFDALDFPLHMKSNPQAILLPHVGEFKRWSGIDVRKLKINARMKLLRKIIGKNNLVINLKDWQSVIAGKNFAYVNHTGNPGMAKGRFGDVLAGLTSGFWAQGMGAFDAASCAAWLNGKMGDTLKEKKWYGYIASDLLDEIKNWKSNHPFFKSE